MKNIFALIGLWALMIVPIAQASDVTVVIDRIGGEDAGNPVISPPEFPWVIDFEGRVLYEGKGGLNQIELSASVNGDYFYGPEALRGNGNDTTYFFTIPWTIPEPGIYQLTIWADHIQRGQKAKSGGCKAAPALANAYLKDTGERDAGDIKKVAKETGKRGELWAKEKCAPDYELRTIEILVGEE